ncbi:MAG TPA: ThiF family adenylyltransferase [Candidatus Limnocylindrales bacterium]|nr:ThiF family adenylyltransferase [Candidatus Limnocylindrales bacterium]
MRNVERGRAVESAPDPNNDIPRVIFYDLAEKSGKKEFTIALKKAQGKRVVLPWSVFAERTQKKAKKKGIYVDNAEVFTRDSLALGKPKDYWDGKEEELARRIAEDDDPKNFIIAHFPFENKASFVKMHRKPEFKRVQQSRSQGIISEVAQEANETKTMGVAGAGVGSAIALESVRAGLENLVIADGGVLTPHDGNRQWGPLARSFGENHAIYTMKQAFQLFPFLNGECIPQNLGTAGEVPNTYDISKFVAKSDFIFDEVDNLKVKAILRYKAREAGKPVAQITDLGTGVAVQFDDPRKDLYPCNGRLTPEVFSELMEADLTNFDTFMYFAINIFMGADNITPETRSSFEESRKREFYHIPQSGIAISKAGTAGYEVFAAYHEGKAIPPERLIGYDWAA